MIFFNAISTLAQAAPAGAGQQSQQGGLLDIFVPMICIGVIFYFMLIRPQQKKQKEQAALIAAAKTGDRVITSAGIHGLITNVKETTFIVKVDDNVKIEMEKSSVAAVVKKSD
jgi:preprotein translocase subunit YajC